MSSYKERPDRVRCHLAVLGPVVLLALLVIGLLPGATIAPPAFNDVLSWLAFVLLHGDRLNDC